MSKKFETESYDSLYNLNGSSIDSQIREYVEKSQPREFDALVYVGRFQPFHNGHKAIIDVAIKQAKEVIVVVGSSFAARDIRNPFTFNERRRMIKSMYPQDNVKVVPVSDYPYDDNKWVAAVQNVVRGAISWSADPVRIGLIGHEKDGTSYYLKIFPTWGSVSVPNVNGINATDIREKLFTSDVDWDEHVPCYDYIPSLPSELFAEYEMIKKYKKPYQKLSRGDIEEWLQENNTSDINLVDLLAKFEKEFRPQFPPIFTTVDTVVVQSGHILLVKRGAMPGKGLWALPGGFLNQDETLLEGALRELKEETKIKVPVPVLRGSIKDSKTFDAPYRSARGRTITEAFFIDLGTGDLPKVRGSDDAEKAFWVPFNEIVKQRDQFFEDHFHICSYFLKIG